MRMNGGQEKYMEERDSFQVSPPFDFYLMLILTLSAGNYVKLN
jgi:hypothetical protein